MSQASNQLVKHFSYLQFTIVAIPGDYEVQYKVYSHDGWDVNLDCPLYHRQGASCYPDFAETLEEAEVYLHGSVKWDGCSDWAIDELSRAMIHGCCKEDLLSIGQIMAEAWDWTAELCPNWFV